jgi:hypothetical protein
MRDRAKGITAVKTRPQHWLEEQLQPDVLLDSCGSPRRQMPNLRAARAEIVRQQLSLGEAALARRSSPIEAAPKSVRKAIDINAASTLVSEWMQARSAGGARGSAVGRSAHTILYTDAAAWQDQRRRQGREEQECAMPHGPPERPPLTYRDVRKASARRREKWAGEALRVREGVAGESESLNSILVGRREELDRAERALDDHGRHEVANLLTAMRRMNVTSVSVFTSQRSAR